MVSSSTGSSFKLFTDCSGIHQWSPCLLYALTYSIVGSELQELFFTDTKSPYSGAFQ
jgi:hypothetical protein